MATQIICNLHTVPITDLITVDSLATIGVALYIGNRYEWQVATIIVFTLLLLLINAQFHAIFGIPTNIGKTIGIAPKNNICI